jgi:GT2 family glycosyltransferase
VGGHEGPVDTVFLGVFDRSAVEAVGLFDERLIRNQDYELNIRLRKAGGEVWFDPELAVGYRPRGTWTALAKQYFEYGYWKSAVLRMHPGSARLRQLVPPVAVLVIVTCTVAGLFRRRALAVPAGYAATVALTSRRAPHPVLQSTVIGLIHVAWSAGVIVGIVRRPT